MPKIFLSLILLLLTFSGCSQFNLLMQADEMEYEIRSDRIRFYEKLGDAYFILGYEYYTLATEAEKTKDWDKATEYGKKARIYNLFYRDAHQNAEDLRAELNSGDRSNAADDWQDEDIPDDDIVMFDAEIDTSNE